MSYAESFCIFSSYGNTAESAKQVFLEYVQNVNTHEAQLQLEANARNEKPEHLAKLVSLGSEKR